MGAHGVPHMRRVCQEHTASTLGCLDGLDKSLLPEHAHRKMNKNHMCCDRQVGLPVQSKSSVMSHQWRTIVLDLESLSINYERC